MKLTKYLPRLNRKQKILRNLLLMFLLLGFLWLVNDFSAPTLELAVKWKAEKYFLDQPEILGVFPREDGEDDVLLRDENVFASTLRRKRFLCFQEALEFFFAQPEEGPVVFLQQRDAFDVTAVYAYAELEGDVRAVCDLRLRSDIDASISDEREYVSRHFDWDETYTMEGTPNENSLYRFAFQRKYPKNHEVGYEEQLWQSAERSTLLDFQAIPRQSAGLDFACDVTITFYGESGEIIYVYQRELWNTLERSGES